MHVNAAHAADLVRDDVAAGQDSLVRAGAVLSDDLFEMPQVLCGSRASPTAFYRPSLGGRERMLAQWPRLEGSSVILIAYCSWLLRYLRIVCNLACVQADPARARLYLRDSQATDRATAEVDLPAFTTYAHALQLVVDAADGRVAPSAKWHEVLNAARRQQLVLLVIALHWHAEILFSNEFERWLENTLSRKAPSIPNG